MNYYLTDSQIKLILESIDYYSNNLEWRNLIQEVSITRKIESLYELNRLITYKSRHNETEPDYLQPLCDY